MFLTISHSWLNNFISVFHFFTFLNKAQPISFENVGQSLLIKLSYDIYSLYKTNRSVQSLKSVTWHDPHARNPACRPPLSTWSPLHLALLWFKLPLSSLIPYLYLYSRFWRWILTWYERKHKVMLSFLTIAHISPLLPGSLLCPRGS